MLTVASHSKKIQWITTAREYIEIWSASIHVNLYQNIVEGYFSSPEHHAKAFDTLLSASFTDCHAAFQKPFLALYQGKKWNNKKMWQVQSSHATSYLPQRYKIILGEYQKFQLTAQLNSVVYLEWEYEDITSLCSISFSSNLYSCYFQYLGFWDSISWIFPHKEQSALHFKYCELISINKYTRKSHEVHMTLPPVTRNSCLILYTTDYSHIMSFFRLMSGSYNLL